MSSKKAIISKIRWFSSELLVVVTGVLIALALNAMWAGKQDSELLDYYLSQIQAENQDSKQKMEFAIEYNDVMWQRVTGLLEAFKTPQPDSIILQLTVITLEEGDVVTGASRALVNSGKLQLVDDESLRSSLIGIIEADENLDEGLRLHSDLMAVPAAYNIWQSRKRIDHPNPVIGISAKEFMEDQAVFSDVQKLYMAYYNIILYQNEALKSINKLDSLLSIYSN